MSNLLKFLKKIVSGTTEKKVSKQSFYAHGKLLLSGEYFVLDGAKALAVPTQKGQLTEVIDNSDLSDIVVTSLDANGEVWFTASYSLPDLIPLNFSDENIGHRMGQVLKACRQLNPNFLQTEEGKILVNTLEFPNEWGLGSSSTLLYNFSQWAEVDVHKLSALTFGGSGYDLACAGANSSILYSKNDDSPVVDSIAFTPSFSHNLLFIHLNKKQNSRDGIKMYREQGTPSYSILESITDISRQMIEANDLASFQQCMHEHENIVSAYIKKSKVQDLHFSDFQGAVKSLGAWGGDFIMAAGENAEQMREYFQKKGFKTIVGYEKMVLG